MKAKKIKEEKESESSASTSLMFGKVKLNKIQKKLKKYKKVLKSIKNKNIRTNVIYLYELTKINNKDLKDKYLSDKALIEKKKVNIFLDYYNKIRGIIKSNDLDFVNKSIIECDTKSYNIDEKDSKSISMKPIKNFWKISLINTQFFYISKRDVAILNYLEDIVFIPLEYPNYKIEFHFKDNKYIKQKILSKEYYYSNIKKEKLNQSLGCEIEWEDDDKNPTLKFSKKKLKEIEEKENMKKNRKKKIKEESPFVNCRSFFNMFDIDKCTIEKDLSEANFIVNDFLPNILEYYLNIIEIKYENEEDELLSNN